MNAFGIHVPSFAPSQQDPEPAIAEPGILSRQFHQCLSQLLVTIRARFITITATVEVEEPASPAFTELKFVHDKHHIPACTHKLHPCFRMTAFRASLSRLRSATISFNRGFSSSGAFGRFASFTSMPPYFDLQLYSV